MNDLISVICPYTNREKLDLYLLASVNRQKYKNYEIILLNNFELELNSASDVLNYGVEHSNGDIIVFAHQDIVLLENNIFTKIVDFCYGYDFGVGCVAGISVEGKGVYSSVIHGKEKNQAGNKLDGIMEVDTCDECFFFIKRDEFLGFEDLGSTWHFYAIAYSLKCRLHNKKIYAIPLPIYHLSSGDSLNHNYWKTLIKLGKKYRGNISVIPTTLGMFKNDCLLPGRVFVSEIYTGIMHYIKMNRN